MVQNVHRPLVARLLVLIVLGAGLTGCLGGGDDPPPTTTPTATPPTSTTPTATTPTATPPPTITTPQWEVAETAFVERAGPAVGGVAAVGYLNEDDHYDVYAGGKLLLGQPDGKFRDATVEAGVECPGCTVLAAAIGDVNEDGANDLVVLVRDEGARLYMNSGTAVFVNAADERGLFGVQGEAVAFADVENDGDLDLAVASKDAPLRVHRNDGAGVFGPAETVAGASGGVFTFVFLDDDALLDLAVATGAGIRLYSNKDGSFTEVAGTPLLSGHPIGSIVVWDYNNDQSVDLLVAHDAGVSVLQNNRRKAFTDRTDETGIDAPASRAAVAFDQDNDGWLDVLALTAAGPVLYRHPGAGGDAFVKVEKAGLGATPFTALAGGDFDRDGRLDVIGLRDGASSLFLNRVDAGPYFTLHLRGNESTYTAVGVKVTLSTGSFVMYRQSGGVGSPAVAMPIDPHFGIGGNLVEKYTLAIKWPSGILQFETIERERVVNRQLNARESASEAPWAEC